MARVSGLEKKDAPWHLRWFYGVMRKMFGKDFTPAKIQMRLPGLVWGGIAMEAGLGRKRLLSLRYIQLGKIRAASRVFLLYITNYLVLMFCALAAAILMLLTPTAQSRGPKSVTSS
jgi:hypothetical protein